MSYINNPSPTGSSTFVPGSIDVILHGGSDEARGTVTGLSSTPAHLITSVLYEEGVTVQSGMVYAFNVTSFIPNGFTWQLRVLENEYWPGTGSVTIKVNYAWSAT